MILNPPSKNNAAVGTSPKANKNVRSMCSIMLCVCVCVRVCVCMYMCMYKCMSMRMCTRYGLNDRDSYSSSRWDKPESQYKCVDNVSNHAVSMCKSMYVYLYVCV